MIGWWLLRGFSVFKSKHADEVQTNHKIHFGLFHLLRTTFPFPSFLPSNKRSRVLLKVSKAGWNSARIFPSNSHSVHLEAFFVEPSRRSCSALRQVTCKPESRNLLDVGVIFATLFQGGPKYSKKKVSQFSFPEFSSIFFWFLPYFRWFTYDTPLAIGRGKPAARWWNSTRFVFSSSATLRRLKPCWRSWKVERVDA